MENIGEGNGFRQKGMEASKGEFSLIDTYISFIVQSNEQRCLITHIK